MTTPDDPQIVKVARVGHSVQVMFKDEGETASFSARMLYSALEANRMALVRVPLIKSLNFADDEFE